MHRNILNKIFLGLQTIVSTVALDKKLNNESKIKLKLTEYPNCNVAISPKIK